MKIVVGSKNPVKIATVTDTIQKVFPDQEHNVIGVDADSNISDQPMDSAETLQGARNRAQHARELEPEADLYVGIEGGIDVIEGDVELMGWAVVIDREGREGKSRSATCSLPKHVQDDLKAGGELSPVWDKYFNTVEIGKGQGVVGYLTDDIVMRKQFIQQALTFALIRFNKKDLYE